MGRATVLASYGEGLYQVKLNYDQAVLNNELTDLIARQATYFAELLRALVSLNLLRQEKSEAREGMDAVIQQWLDGLIDKLNAAPPPIEPTEPNDPETGEPWEDPDRAQDAPLLAAINAARSAASVSTLSRDDDLDQAMRDFLRDVASAGTAGHFGVARSKPEQRVTWAGYTYSATVGVGELLAPGERSAEAAVARWKRTESTTLLNPAYTECGVAFKNTPDHLYGYLWGVILAAPGTAESLVTENDPAQEAAAESEAELERIAMPSVANFAPEKMAEVAGAFARAARKVTVAEEQISRLKLEYQSRDQRIAELQALITAYEQPIDIWACQFEEIAITIGGTVATAEVPGFFNPVAAPRTTTMGVRDDPNFQIPDVVKGYDERSINIIPNYRLTDPGTLRSGSVMSDAAVFVNAALEPGHLRWKPLWRYGVITALSESICSVTLDSMLHRGAGAADLVLDDADDLALTNVPISYPPCDGLVFEIGDAVLVLFEGFDRDAPKVIGFRREPRPCPGERVSWEEL